MSDFSKALAWVEGTVQLLRERGVMSDNYFYNTDLAHILCQHADSIVKLGRVAAEMREELRLRDCDSEAYDKLMKETGND